MPRADLSMHDDTRASPRRPLRAAPASLALWLALSSCGPAEAVSDGGLDAGAVVDAARDARAAPTDASGGDDAALSDAGARSLSLGRCVNEAGEDCEGDVEGGRFEALAPDSVVPIVIGFQGSPMFVLALRAVGVDPGDPEDPFGPDNPQVELLVFDEAGVEVAAYRDRAPLHVEAGGAEGLSYFVVLGGATSEVADAPLRVDAWLRDRAGVELRASLDIVAGPAP